MITDNTSTTTTTTSSSSSSNNNPYIFFQAGVTATLRSWSALRTAVEQSWGGANSHSKAEDLRSNIFHYYDGQSTKMKMDVFELEDNLLIYMEDEFGVVLEDGSEREVANLICNMYEACVGKGDVSLAQSVVQDAMRAEEVIRASNVKSVFQDGQEDVEDIEEEDSCDDEDDMMEEDYGDAMGDGAGNTNHSELGRREQDESMGDGAKANQISMEQAFAFGSLFGGPPTKPKTELPPPRQLGEPEPEKPQPVVDDDGFAMVPTKKKGGSKRA
jgi:pre-rRNA-processing protein TSR2